VSTSEDAQEIPKGDRAGTTDDGSDGPGTSRTKHILLWLAGVRLTLALLRLVVLARFAIFPVGLLAAAGGASDLEPRRFFLADGAGLVGAVGLVVGTGYELGVGTNKAGPWLAPIGVSALVGISAYLTWNCGAAGTRQTIERALRKRHLADGTCPICVTVSIRRWKTPTPPSPS